MLHNSFPKLLTNRREVGAARSNTRTASRTASHCDLSYCVNRDLHCWHIEYMYIRTLWDHRCSHYGQGNCRHTIIYVLLLVVASENNRQQGVLHRVHLSDLQDSSHTATYTTQYVYVHCLWVHMLKQYHMITLWVHTYVYLYNIVYLHCGVTTSNI